MLINTILDTEDFVHLYYPEDEGAPGPQGCGAGARMASKYPPRLPTPEYSQESASSSEMSERERYRPPPPEPPPHRVRAADLYPRLRTHYDEPGLDVGFTTICGEFVQWVGRTADGGTIAMSNYRLHLQPRKRSGPGASVPLRLIDALEIRDLLHLVVMCKHGRQLKCTFATNDSCVEWWRRLNTALAPIPSIQETFAAAYAAWAKEQPPASVHRALMKASHAPQRHWFGPEVERLGFTTKGLWRVCAANAEYKLCPSYPPLLVVPAAICDEDLDSVARFRAMRRIPAVVWRHRGNGAVIARSSQPEVGWLGWRSSEDERLLAALLAATASDSPMPVAQANQVKLLIVDARSYASAVTNRARGGGCECAQYYPRADIQFMSLPNIHHVRRSFQQLRALHAEPGDQPSWHSSLERTLWLQYVGGVLRAACVVARAVLAGRPVLVHCSDGWDRTPQIVATAQLLLDPHYRTRQGFRTLIEREWLDFGHKFADRCGHQFGTEDPNERSPIFLQWLDVVHQLMLQYPCSFDFNEAYLIKLATHVHSCMFGTFLCNTRLERAEARAGDAAQVWQLLRAPAYSNHLYCAAPDQVLWPEYSVRSMQPFWAMFCGERSEPDDEAEPPTVPSTQNGLMTKTRSCDNLLNEGEKRTAQRRCSDPSIPPDVMKLSLVAGVGKRALTDGSADELPTLPGNQNGDIETQTEVELHPDHFENTSPPPQDLASNSSSLERELAPACNHIDSDTAGTSDDVGKDSVVENAIRSALRSEGDTPDEIIENNESNDANDAIESNEFVCGSYQDVLGIQEAARESARTRNISITWRSISESSNQSLAGFDIPDSAHSKNEPTAEQDSPTSSHESSPLDNHNSTDGDVANHNVLQLTNHNRSNGVTKVEANGVDEISAKFLEVDMNGAASSSGSSESEGEGREGGAGGAGGRARGSQLTLCPASPRRRAVTRPRGTNTSNLRIMLVRYLRRRDGRLSREVRVWGQQQPTRGSPRRFADLAGPLADEVAPDYIEAEEGGGGVEWSAAGRARGAQASGRALRAAASARARARHQDAHTRMQQRVVNLNLSVGRRVVGVVERGGGGRGGARLAARPRGAALPALLRALLAGAAPPPLPEVRRDILRVVLHHLRRVGRRAAVPRVPQQAVTPRGPASPREPPRAPACPREPPPGRRDPQC